MYPREQYLNKIISKKDNGRIKIITGLRRSGKSVLLFQLYREWLLGEGVKEDQIIALALDILENARYRNPLELDKYIRNHMIDPKKNYYIFIDEIQLVSEIQNPFVDNEDAKIKSQSPRQMTVRVFLRLVGAFEGSFCMASALWQHFD